MRIALLGVGLIGGSIGLAARKRLGAEVIGYDADAETLKRARDAGVVSIAACSPREACVGAEVVFCATPVGSLPEVVAEALAVTNDEAVITDVGSTKRGLVERVSAESRFIGGHPLAGAETAGVENARADLFEGARWYLTPTPAASGMLYDRLQRVVADLGARPQAIDAETHDRVMASVSHLPHVMANALASQAAQALADEHERLPEVGPSFRDTTRVAGANPAIWRDIFLANRDTLAGEIDGVIERLRSAAEMLRSGDADALTAWIEQARDDRRHLLEAELAGGPVHELRVAVANQPGVVAELALALGRAGVNIEDMALYPAADMQSGAVTLWIAGDEESSRALSLVQELGYTASRVAGGGE